MRRVLAVAGPTASGKSTLVHALALRLGGQIVVADPFQRYRGLEIAADAPGEVERSQVAYHCVGDLRLDQPSTVADFAGAAHLAIDACVHAGQQPIVSGGTGLYLRAALSELEFPPQRDEKTDSWAQMLAVNDLAAAMDALRRADPELAQRVDSQNPRRVARALAVATGGGSIRPSDALWSNETRRPAVTVKLSRPRAVLDARIAARVDRELADGLFAELEAALETPEVCREALQIIGAKEVAAIRSGELSVSDLPERLAARTRRLARKQLTWLRKMPADAEIDLGDGPAEDACEQITGLLHGYGR